MGEHTPGPWAVNPIYAQVDCGKESRIGGLLPVARMLWPTDERSEAETEANARLIAAAPELLEAAQRVLHVMSNTTAPPPVVEAFDALTSACAQATGSTLTGRSS